MTINLWCWYIYIYFRYLIIIYLLLQKRKISFVLFWKEVKQDINTYDKVKQEKLEFQLMFVFDFFRLAWTWKEHVCYQDYENGFMLCDLGKENSSSSFWFCSFPIAFVPTWINSRWKGNGQNQKEEDQFS